ncbi:MAG: hypothetical protein DWQ02_15845 [Bacteroidetes bacterium]|nr:MAG: hypothetical protein DWQ02_15845 [Bacteroidota bacterium]
MELFINCKNCREDFKVDSSAITRGELEDELGRYFRMQCSECLSFQEYHVNNVRARVNMRQILIFGAAMAVLAIVLTLIFLSAGLIASLSIVLPIIAFSYFYQSKSASANQFNRMLIKRDRKE